MNKKPALSIYLLLLLLFIALPTLTAADDYIIAPGDKINVSVWGNKDLSNQITVRSDGKISFPLIGEVKASGLTPLQLREKIASQLAEFVNNPEVTVNLVESDQLTIYIFGNLKASGEKKFKGNTNLLQLFSMIGSLPSHIDLKTSFLIRNNDKLPVDMYRLIKEGDLTQNVFLKSGDTIFLKDNLQIAAPAPTAIVDKFTSKIRVVGEVKNEKTIDYEPGMTLLDAISAAGGLTPYARPTATKVIRRQNDKIEEILINLDAVREGQVDKNIKLEPGDMISVPASLF